MKPNRTESKCNKTNTARTEKLKLRLNRLYNAITSEGGVHAEWPELPYPKPSNGKEHDANIVCLEGLMLKAKKQLDSMRTAKGQV